MRLVGVAHIPGVALRVTYQSEPWYPTSKTEAVAPIVKKICFHGY
jgi:hypothetical protein